MRFLKIILDPRFRWNDVTIWRVLERRLHNKVRNTIVGRFNKALYFTRRKRQFTNFCVEMKFYAGFENRAGIKQFLQSQPIYQMQILRQAEKIISHCFNLLGSGEVNLGSRIDWHCDFKSGYHWSRECYQRIILEEQSQAYLHSLTDIKVPWELSRFQHLVLLGQAYWLSGDEKFTEEFISEIVDWTDGNPPEMGVNWACSMEISLRVISLIFAYYFFHTSPVISKTFWERYFTLLYYSGVHIEQNPEVDFWGYRNNHHLMNCAALFWLGLFFDRFNNRTRTWLKKGIANLVKEMKYQVNPDGGSFEGSISYHRLALETFLYTTILAEKNGLLFPASYMSNLEKMCNLSRDYLKPNGLAPQFGDADDGRFCILSGYGTEDRLDHRSLLGVAGEYFQKNDLRKAAADKNWDAVWIFGKRGKPKSIYEDGKFLYPEIVSYPETGYYIIRSDNMFLIFKCSRIGQKNLGGHDHNDQLSFELNINGTDLIVDPGTYVYTMDKNLRHQFRSTKYHNVSQNGDFEQNVIKNETLKDLFSMYSANPGVCQFFGKKSPEIIVFKGQIAISGTEVQYFRTVEVRQAEKRIDIIDSLSKAQEGGTCRLHLAQDVQVEQCGERIVEISCNNVQARIEAETLIRVEPGLVSPSYGRKYSSSILNWSFQGRTKFTISY